MDREQLRQQMVQAFRIYAQINPSYMKPREGAWADYCQAREAYLADCWGKAYVALHQLIRIPGPYDP
jgi:hypothetical protein